MLQQNVAAANRGEDVLVLVLGQRRRHGRNKRRELQVGPVQLGQVTHPHQRQRAADNLVDVLALQFQIVGQDLQHRRGHVFRDFHANHVGKAPLPHAFLHRLQQIAGFQVLNGDFGVARDMEGMRLQNLHAREQRRQVGDNHLLNPDEALLLAGAASWISSSSPAQRHQRGQGVRNLDARKVLDRLSGHAARPPGSG